MTTGHDLLSAAPRELGSPDRGDVVPGLIAGLARIAEALEKIAKILAVTGAPPNSPARGAARVLGHSKIKPGRR